jgi:hypothetical protein
MKPSRSAPAPAAQRASHCPAAQERSHLGAGVRRPNQRLADEHGVGPHGRQAGRIGRRMDAALGDQDRAGGDRGPQAGRGFQVHGKGVQVAVVDAHEAWRDPQGTLQLGLVVDLDQGVHAQRQHQAVEGCQLAVVQGGDDEQYGVGAGSPGLVDLVGIEKKVLAQDRQLDRRPHGAQVIEMALEKALVGQHADGCRAVGLVGPGQGHRVEIRAEQAPASDRPGARSAAARLRAGGAWAAAAAAAACTVARGTASWQRAISARFQRRISSRMVGRAI